MDAKEFMKEAKRMCIYYHINHLGCVACPANYMQCGGAPRSHDEKLVEVVEKWSKEHPIMTNRQHFEQEFGIEINASHEYEGYLFLNGLRGTKEEVNKWLNAEYKEPEENIDGC